MSNLFSVHGDARRSESAEQDGDQHDVGSVSRGSENARRVFKSRSFEIKKLKFLI